MRGSEDRGRGVACVRAKGSYERRGGVLRLAKAALIGSVLGVAPVALASGTWTVESVSRSLGWLTTVEHDAQGNPAFGYFVSSSDASSAPAGTVLYVVRTGSGWTTEVVQPTGGSRAYLAYAPSGEPTMAYRRTQQSKRDKDSLVYAVRTGAGWTYEVVEETSGQACGLAYDASGNPCVLYTRPGKGSQVPSLRFARRSGGVWSAETVASRAADGDLALDADGTPCASYAYDGSLYFTQRGPSGWSSQWIDLTSAGVGRPPSLSLNPVSGTPGIAYPAADDGIRYASWNGSDWDTEYVTTDVAWAGRVAFDSQGGAVVGCHRLGGGGNETLVGRRSAGGWTLDVVDTAPDGSVGYLALGLHDDVVSVVYPWADFDAGIPRETRYAVEAP